MSNSFIPPIQSSSFVQDGHCQASMEVGTNYSPLVHHSNVQTAFSLRFEGGYPVQVQPVYDARQQTVGWELRVTGIDELQHLVMAFEAAAAELRRQAGGLLQEEQTPRPLSESAEVAQNDPLVQPPATKPDTMAAAVAQRERSELSVLRLLVIYGREPLANGNGAGDYLQQEPLANCKVVGDYLQRALTQTPLASPGLAQLWEKSTALLASGIELPTTWLSENASGLSQNIQEAIETENAYLVRYPRHFEGGQIPEEAKNLLRTCDRALTHLHRDRVRVERERLLAQISDETLSEEEQMGLISTYQDLAKEELQLGEKISKGVF
jgi:hypothetical protein